MSERVSECVGMYSRIRVRVWVPVYVSVCVCVCLNVCYTRSLLSTSVCSFA